MCADENSDESLGNENTDFKFQFFIALIRHTRNRQTFETLSDNQGPSFIQST